MLRGFALAILLLNLALLMWGSSRPAPQALVPKADDQAPAAALPTLTLIDEAQHDPVDAASVRVPCLRIGPLAPDDAETAVSSATAWNLSWRRSDGEEGSFLDVKPGTGSTLPEIELQALADALAAEISPCQAADPIAPEPRRP